MRCLVNQVFYLISLLFLVGGEIRAPPNINPQQQYQQVPVQQQVHVPVQQMPVQQMPVQQMPVQQMPVQQMPMQQGTSQQQIPVQQGAHVHGQMDPKLLNTANINQEKAHIQEHMAVPLDTSKMTEQELQFHYFKMHDADNNNKLDGCELIKSLIHWHEQGGRDHAGQQTPPQDKIFSDEELMQLIDPILQMDDMNGDGYIDYPEFVRAQQKAAAAQAQVQRRG